MIAFVGAILIVLIIGLILRKLITKLFKLNKKVASSIACLLAVTFCVAGALSQMGNVALVIYPVGGLIVWIFLFFDLPIFKRKKL
jgi:hypothetical protein